MMTVPIRGAAIVAVLVIAGNLQLHPTFRGGVDVVSVDASVLKGRTSVGGLTSADFAVSDNGVPQQVDAVPVEAVSIDVTVLADVSGSAGRLFVSETTHLARQIESLLRPADRLRVVAFGTDVQELIPLQPMTRDLTLPVLTAGGRTSLDDAIAWTLITGERAPNRRRLTVIFTDGYENASFVGEDALIAVMKRADTLLHLVSPATASTRGPGFPDWFTDLVTMTGGERHEVLDASAGDDGSVLLKPPSEMAIVDSFRRILDDFRRSYVLYYTLRGVPRAGWHDVTVKIVTPGGEKYTVRARKGYFGE